MKHTLTQGNNSNYEISLTVQAEDLAKHKQKALQQFQKEMAEPGFRKGHVPLDIVEKKIRPEYLEIALYEEVIHAGTKEIINANQEIKFIGNIYDLHRTEKDDASIFTFKLDVYPEVTVKNDKWNKLTISKIDAEPTQEEIDQTLSNLQKQYASYEETDTVADNSVFKISFVHNDKDGTEIDKGTAYLGKEELEEFPKLKTLFIGKKKDESFQTPYEEKKVSPMLHNRSKDTKATTTVYTITDVRSVTLPDFTEENIKKFFGNDEVKTKEQLMEKITDLIRKQKEESLLMQSVDTMLDDAGKSLDITIPKTLIDEEMKTRMKSLEERMGGAEGIQKYFEQVGEEEKNKMMAEIKTAAESSLQKFFILRKLTELLELKDIDWKQPLNVERKLYDILAK